LRVLKHPSPHPSPHAAWGEGVKSARRDGAVIALIGFSHFTSHFFQLALPPLFPLLKGDFDVSYTALGAVMSLFYAASGVGQAIAGFLVDRFGGWRVLVFGTTLLAVSIAAAGLTSEFWMLYPLAFFAGVGNSVYHPANYAILSHCVSKPRLGRAYSVHGLGGTLGYASAPVAVGALTHLWSWPVALLLCAVMGAALVTLLVRSRAMLEASAEPATASAETAPQNDVLGLVANPAIVAGFFYFALAATVTIGMQSASVPAVISLYEVPLAVAAAMLTAFLVANAAGMLAGGFIADRITRHDRMAIGGVLISAVAMVAIGVLPLPFAIVVALAIGAGFALGATNPARDLLIRAASPPGATGRVFGLVYSGLDLGSATMPVVAGWLLDHGAPRTLFLLFALALVLTVVTVIGVRRRPIALPAE
jgi:MFS transporter, FSR family, fosmidomycin resistance protein